MRPVHLFPIALLLVACGEPPATVSTGRPPAPVTPAATALHGLDAGQVARGGEVYKTHCAACHGVNAEGAPNWSKRGPDGKYPAPPLDGSGHGWHHPKSDLVRTIREGTVTRGGGMPAWKGILSDADIDAAIAWFQSRWPEEIYRSWAMMDEKWRREAPSTDLRTEKWRREAPSTDLRTEQARKVPTRP